MKLYRGTTTGSSDFKAAMSGRLPRYTWLTDNPTEALKYSKAKERSGRNQYGQPIKGRPIVLEYEVPGVDKMWLLGGGSEGNSKILQDLQTYSCIWSERTLTSDCVDWT